MLEVYTMDKLVRVLRNFGIVVSNPNRPFRTNEGVNKGQCQAQDFDPDVHPWLQFQFFQNY